MRFSLFRKSQLCLALFAAAGMAMADGRVEGTVSSGARDTGLEGAVVRIKELNLEVVTDRRGDYSFPAVKAGSYTLTVEYLGAEAVSRSIQISDDAILEEDISLSGGNNAMDQVLVVGQAAGINKALNQQRAADNIKSIVSADAIGQFPDANTAEALSRLPGVSIERDQGEGRFVRVRGLGANLNAVNINGSLVPSPADDERAVALDVVPSDLLESLEVTKAVTPDMEANSLGGSINVRSLSAFDRDGMFFKVNAEASKDGVVDKTSPKGAVTLSNQFDTGAGANTLGVAAAISWYDRDFGSDNVETGGAWDFDAGPALEEFEQRDYVITRERLGATFNVDYRPDSSSEYFIRTLLSEFTDTEIRHANIIEFDSAQTSGQTGDAEIARELKDRKETAEITSVVFGGKNIFDDWTVEYQAGLSEAGEDTPYHVDAAVFEGSATFNNVGFSGTREPDLIAPNAVYNAGNYELAEVEAAEQITTDEENHIKIDLTRQLFWNNNPAEMKFGIKSSRRDKDSDEDIWVFENFGGADTSMSAYTAGTVDYDLDRFGPEISSNAVESLIGGLDQSAAFDAEESRINDFDMSEDIDAAYLMGTVNYDRLRILGGFRYEDTALSADGTELRDGSFSARKEKNDYDHLLPSLHARYELSDKTLLRGAFTQTIVRPTFGQLFPGAVIDTGDAEAEFGNPELDPLESSNLDLGIEHYFGRAGVVSAFLFYKDIDNFIYEADVAGTGEWAAFDEAITFLNGDSADLTGLELSFSRQFSELPGAWSGLLLGANATFTDSDAKISSSNGTSLESRDIPLPSQSDTTANLVLGYETNKMSLRLSGNYKSEYLVEVADPLDERYDVYESDHMQVDFTSHYFATPNLKISFEAINLNDEPYYAYTNSERFNFQYEEYDPTYKLGVTYTNF
jgi:TonB-dependent receptor